MDFRLEDRAIIAVSGPAARDFLQGLVTNDIGRVDTTSLHYAALLTPQGKILFDFLMGEQDGALLLDCPRSLRDALAKRLTLYRLRAKVEIALRDDLAVIWRDARDATEPFRRDPRHPELGWRAIMSNEAAPSETGATKLESVRLRLGLPEGLDFGQDKVFALDGDLDELSAIAFDKGCYVGQELTARMKHRGAARKRVLPLAAASARALPVAGTTLTSEDREIGTILSTYNDRGFALVRLDRLPETETVIARAQDTTVTLQKPAWLFT
jgi:folate-binding protein YgfZ